MWGGDDPGRAVSAAASEASIQSKQMRGFYNI